MWDNLVTGEDVDNTKPIQVKYKDENTYLTNIVQISSGYNHSVALGTDGSIYTWGANDKGQLGNGANDNSNIAIKIDGINDVVKVRAYRNITFAITKDGNVYAWGEGYSSLPMRLISSHKMVDFSGGIFLSEEGFVYNLSDIENRISSYSQIAKISGGNDHYLALSVHGYAYSWGANNQYGELARTTSSVTTAISKDLYEIVAGNDTTFVKNKEGEFYRAGCNANGRIGLRFYCKHKYTNKNRYRTRYRMYINRKWNTFGNF